MNNKKESIFSIPSALKKMNNSEKSILAGHSPPPASHSPKQKRRRSASTSWPSSLFFVLLNISSLILFIRVHFFVRKYMLFAQQQIFEKMNQESFILFLTLIMVKHEGIPKIGGMLTEERIIDMETQFP
ncbi:hypothetical protein C8U37_11061 [Trichococcus patagoniensis]|uniref:Uncharacterized protein n=1 Tax=Trichococcus patagoniensis TaxID=382641 RepID=A0A2T5IJY4_9LACT|nr:hypothetical protein C8U37_11061 [Trichococcus patagoniensis]